MQAINDYVIVDKIKEGPKKVGGLILTDETDETNRYRKANIISVGNLVEIVKKGDTILVGKFKNKKMVIKDIGVDKHGMPTINGRKATTFRIHKKVNIFDKGFSEKIDRDAEGYGKYDEPDDSDFDEPSKTKKLESKSNYKQIMEM